MSKSSAQHGGVSESLRGRRPSTLNRHYRNVCRCRVVQDVASTDKVVQCRRWVSMKLPKPKGLVSQAVLGGTELGSGGPHRGSRSRLKEVALLVCYLSLGLSNLGPYLVGCNFTYLVIIKTQ